MTKPYCVLPARGDPRGRSFRYLTVAMRWAEQCWLSSQKPLYYRDVELYIDHGNGKREHATLQQQFGSSYPKWIWHREIGSIWK